jgi:hypothetical protein
VRAAGWIALWGSFLLVLTLMMLPFREIDAISPALLGGAALGTLVLAAAAWRSGRAGDEHGLDASPGTVGLALGVALLVGGSEVGPWMLALGAGLVALGIAGLVAERRSP